VFNRFLYLTFARLRQPRTMQRARKKETPNFAEFSSKNQVSVSLVMLKSK
jgi:hypothetical protein